MTIMPFVVWVIWGFGGGKLGKTLIMMKWESGHDRDDDSGITSKEFVVLFDRKVKNLTKYFFGTMFCF
jgi:hypothetical protein